MNANQVLEDELVDLIGKIEIKYDNNIKDIESVNNQIQSGQYMQLLTNLNNFKILALPNEHLIVLTLDSANMAQHQINVFNKKFHLIKIVNKLENKNFILTDMTTNDIDRIFMSSYMDNSIYVCDLELNLLKHIQTFNGSNFNDFDGPYGLAYSSYNSCLYVCDSFNKRIKMLNSIDYVVNDNFIIDVPPFEIRCFGVNNEKLCIKSDKFYQTINRANAMINLNAQFYRYYFYDIKNNKFQLVAVYEYEEDFILCSLNANLYLIETNFKKFIHFNNECILKNQINIDKFKINEFNRKSLFNSFLNDNNKIENICIENTKKTRNSTEKSFYCTSGTCFNQHFIFTDELKRSFIFI